MRDLICGHDSCIIYSSNGRQRLGYISHSSYYPCFLHRLARLHVVPLQNLVLPIRWLFLVMVLFIIGAG